MCQIEIAFIFLIRTIQHSGRDERWEHMHLLHIYLLLTFGISPLTFYKTV